MLSFAALAMVAAVPGNSLAANQTQLAFVENRGQWSAEAKFLARTPNADLWVTDYGLSVDYFEASPARRKGHVVQIAFEGGQLGNAVGKTRLSGVENYLGTASGNILGVQRYAETTIQGVYPAVDARYYFDGTAPRYDLVLKPGADSSRVKLRYNGASNVRVGKDGNLRYDTSLGTIVESGLYAFQRSAAGERQVAAKPVVNTDGSVSYRLGAYDKSLPLIIDPRFERNATYSGSSMSVVGIVNQGSSVYVAGSSATATTRSAGAYTTPATETGSFAYIRKEDTSGNLQWATYVGNNLIAADLAVDSTGRPIVVGRTSTTTGGFVATGPQTSNGSTGGRTDGFGFRLSSTGNALNWGSYFGGNNAETANSVAIGANDNFYIAGTSNTNNWNPAYTTNTGFDQSQNAGFDAWCTYISAAGSAISGTFIGASGDDGFNKVVYDSATNTVYLAGYAGSNAVSATSNYGTFGGGTTDGMVVRMNQNLTQLTSRRYYGGTGTAAINSIAVNGTTVLAGGVSGTTPTTQGLLATTGLDLSTLGFSTTLGGSSDDTIKQVGFDANGQILAVGNTTSSNFPVTTNALDKTFDAAQDGFFARYTPTGTLQYASYLGNTGTDSADAVYVTTGGSILVGGTNNSGAAVLYEISMAPVVANNAVTVTSAQPFYGSNGRNLNLQATVDIASNTTQTIAITSSNTNVLASGTLTIPANSTTGTVSLASQPVFYDTTVTLSYTGGSFDVVVKAPNTSTVIVGDGSNPLASVGGVRLTGVVTLGTPAGVGGQWVKRTIVESGTTTSRDKTWAGVTTNFFFPEGTSSLPFEVSLAATTVERNIQVFAAGGSTGVRSNTIKIVPMNVASLEVVPATVAGGKYVYITPTLTAPAPAGGVVVNLTSSAPGVVNVPSTVTIAEGTVSNKVQVQAGSVASDTVVTIGASYAGGTAVTQNVTITAPTIQSLVLNTSTIAPGARVYGYVKLSANAPTGGINVTISVPEASGVRFYQESGVYSKSVTVAGGTNIGPLPKFILQFPSTISPGTVVPVTATLNGVETTVDVTVTNG